VSAEPVSAVMPPPLSPTNKLVADAERKTVTGATVSVNSVVVAVVNAVAVESTVESGMPTRPIGDDDEVPYM